jgi:hypothetical protein
LKKQREELSILGIILILLFALIGLTWANYQFGLQNPGGNDFLPRWVGTRLFLTQDLSPYSDAVNREIQDMIFGREALSGEDKSWFVYPFYSIFIYTPYALFADYNLARALWMTTLQISLIAITLGSLSLSRWRLHPVWLIFLMIFSLLWYHAARPLINGNTAIMIALMIVGALLAIRAKLDSLAGFLLAMTTIKPQMVILLIPFIFLWAISQKRWMLIWSTLGILIIMIAGMSLLIPDWIIQNLRQVLTYPNYTLPGTPGAILQAWLPGVGSELGWLLTIILAGVLIWEWRAAWGKDFEWFFYTACLTLVITNLIGIRTTTANYIALVPALILLFASWDRHWDRFGKFLIGFSYLLLLLGLWWLFLTTLSQTQHQATQSSVMFFPLPILLLLGLYWIRWWVVQPEKLWLDQLKKFH